MKNLWVWIWLAVVSSGLAAPPPMDSVERGAKLYLRACITAVLTASMYLPRGGLPALWNGTSCADPIFSLASSHIEEPTPPAIRQSRIEVGSQWTDGFQVVVTDGVGRVWTGEPGRLPPVPPSSGPLSREVQAARQAAQESFAQNFLRQCFRALRERVDASPLTSEWEGRSCADSWLVAAVPAAGQPLPQSLIHLRPDTEEGVEVTVTAVSGQIYRLPEQPTLLPPPALRDTPAYQFGVWVAAMVGLAATLLFLTFVPGGRSAAGLGAVLGGIGSLLLWAVLHTPQSELVGVILTAVLLVWIGSGVLGSLPRMVYWAHRERWWEALGTSLTLALLLTPPLTFVYFASAGSVFSAPSRSGWTALVILLAVVGVARSRTGNSRRGNRG